MSSSSCQAVQCRSLQCVDQLLRAGAPSNPIDEAGQTPLHIAASLGDTNIVHVLLDHKAHINSQDAVCSELALSAALILFPTQAGHTPLALAVMNDHAMFVELMVRKKADVNLVNSRKQ